MRSEAGSCLDLSHQFGKGSLLYLRLRLFLYIIPFGTGISGVFFTEDYFLEIFLGWFIWSVVCIGFTISVRVWFWFSLFFIGWISGGHELGLSSSDHLRQIQGDRVDGVGFRGKWIEGRRLGEDAQEWVLEGVGMKRWDGSAWIKIKGRVVCRVKTLANGFPEKDQEVDLAGVLGAISRPMSEGQFDSQRFWWGKQVFYELRHARMLTAWTSNDRGESGESFKVAIQKWCAAGLSRGAVEGYLEYGLLRAMVLGEREGVTSEMKEVFVETGTYHLFAISGLHVGVVGGVFWFLGRMVFRNRWGAAFFGVILVWMYIWMSGWQTSAWRAGLMFTFWMLGSLTKRPHMGVSIWCASAWAILIWDPMQLWQAGFQLSFSVVFFLIVVFPVIQDRFRLFCLGDGEESRKILGGGAHWDWLRRGGYGMGNQLLVSFLAWMGGLPWIVYYFGLVTPGAIVANVVVVLICAWVMVASVGSLVVGFVWEWGQECFNLSAIFAMRCLVEWVRWCQNQSWMFFKVRALEVWVFVPWFFGLLGWSGWFLWKRASWGLGFFGIGLVLVWIGQFGDGMEGGGRMSVLPMDGGDSVVVQMEGDPEGFELIDCGQEWEVNHRLIPFLEWNGLGVLKRVFYSHGDYRHCEGWEILEDRFPAIEVVTSRHRSRSPSYQKLRRYLEAEAGGKWLEVQAKDRVGEWEVLHPPRDARGTQADDWCLVLKRNLLSWKVLLVSDLSAVGQIELLNLVGGEDLKADVVVCGIPNEREPLIPFLLEAVQPKVIVLNGGIAPGTLKMTPHLRERLSYSGASLFITEEDGQVDAWFSEGMIRIKGYGSGKEVLIRQ